jgi:nucleotide-binding universal stress UspA family protein
MFTHILVPLDGTSTGDAALPYAHALARRCGARVTPVHAAQPHAPVAEWIVAQSALLHADLIVMATHARSGPDHWLHGSVAETVVSRSSTPVLLVRAHAPRWEARFEAPTPTFVVPLDFSELAEAALPVAQELVEATHGRLLLLSVIPLPTSGDLFLQQGVYLAYSPNDYTAFEEEAHAYLDRVSADVRRTTSSVETQVRLGEPAVEITAAAAQAGAAAIVMATHGRTGLTRSVMGSITGLVLRQSPMPTLLVRPAPMCATLEAASNTDAYPRATAAAAAR